MSKQMAWPNGCIMELWIKRRPPKSGHEKLDPAMQVNRGYVYIRAADAARLSPGEAIQIDRNHAVINAIDPVESVLIGSTETVPACRVRLGDVSWL